MDISLLDEEFTGRLYKGNSIIDFPINYVVIDIETTGLDPFYDKIIEISALKIKDNNVADTFSFLINPGFEIDDFIIELTGITNEMLKDAPSISDVLPKLRDFIGNDILVGHNVNFDINFLYDNYISCNIGYLKNDFIDTMRLGRRLHKELPHHRLSDLANKFNVNTDGSHRALKDCYITFEVFNHLKESAIIQFDDIETFKANYKKKQVGFKVKDLIQNEGFAEPDNMLYGRNIAITGTLEKMTRKEAMQIIIDIGGICNDNVLSKTNFLILGNNDYNPILKGAKSSKQLKAEKMKLDGFDIEILSENVFYDLIKDYLKAKKN